jgi:NADPH:quinone reductase-like Zn-dependent oxidoreductase
MRALATDRYGELERLKVIEMPLPEPGEGEVRVRVRASALNPADYKVALGKVKFLHARNFPMVLGYDFSGTVQAVGRNVSQVGAGAEVFGFVPYSPTNRRGAFAEAVIARADQLAVKPQGVSHAQAAAAATPGATAIQSLRDLGRLREGMKVVVTGVSGGVGSIGVAIAKKLGGKVIAVGSGRGLQLAREMGADEVVDRKQSGAVGGLKGPYDVFFDAAAAYRWSHWRGRLSRGGTFITTLPSLSFVVDKLSSYLSNSRCAVAMVKSKPADLRLLGEWLSGGLTVAVDRTISLAEVPENLARLERSEVLGRVVVEIGG